MSKEKQLLIYIITALALVIAARGVMSIVACDDAFITFRYAENIATGNGFVYNEGEKILGTSTPMFTLLLALLRLFGIDVVFASHVLSILFHFAISLLILLILKEQGYYFAGVIASFCFALDKLAMTAYGMETNLYVALFLGSFYYQSKSKILTSWIFASMMAFCRADGFIWMLVLFIITVLRYKGDLIKVLSTSFFMILPWFSFSYFYFGDVLPHTVSVKLLNVSFFYNSFISGVPYYLKEFYPYFLPLSLLGVLICLKKREQIVFIFIFDLIYLAVFTLFRAQHSHWYFIPLVPAIYIYFAIGIEVFIRDVLKWEETASSKVFEKAIILLPAILVIFFGIKFVSNIDNLCIPDKSSKAYYYKETGLWLRDNTSKDAKVMMGEIGIMGYYSNRRIVDMGGLVTLLDDVPERSPEVIAEHFKPEYYISGSGNNEEELALGKFYYELAAIIEGRIGIYRKVDDMEPHDIERLPKNDTIKQEIKDDPASKLNFLRDFTGRD